MLLFIFTCIALFITAFLVMIAIQLIGIEKVISEITEITELHVKKIYGKKL